MSKLSNEAYTEVTELLHNEIENNKGMGHTDRLEHLNTVLEEIEGIGTY